MIITHRKSIRLTALLLVLLLVASLLPTQAFAAPAIQSITVTGLDRPVIGAHPDLTFSVSAGEIKDGIDDYLVRWYNVYDDSLMTENDVFESNNLYYAAVYVTPRIGYTFASDDNEQYLGTVSMRDFDKDYPAAIDDNILYFYTIDYPLTDFVDVPIDSYYASSVLLAYINEITAGTDATHFSPNQPCTRAQAMTFLWRASGMPEPETSYNPFSDVSPSSYYYNAVLWAAENDITTGTTPTTFSPNKPCTRAQIVTLLWRLLGAPMLQSLDNPFDDVPSTSYSLLPILWAAEAGVTQGTSSSTFSPNKVCTRAQIVTFIIRALTPAA